MFKKLSFALCLLMFSGCATALSVNLTHHKGDCVPSGNPDVGLIYIYRENHFFGSVRGIYIDVNGKRVGALNNATYFVYEAAPGEIVVSAENWINEDKAVTIQVEAGKTYYVKGGLDFGVIDIIPILALVSDDAGAGAIRKLSYATMKEKDLKK